MGGPLGDLKTMLAGLKPVIAEDHGWVFTSEGDEPRDGTPFAVIMEAEGATRIMPAHPADTGPIFARITLQVHSDLEAVGLTAAVSTVLADAGIACNVVAGLHHDHLFVPRNRREEALAILNCLSQDARR